MGEAFITRRGGGTPYAAIGVTYPSGSVCTCTNGTLTLTAKDTTGKAIFVIPSAGTWTVKAVSGSKTLGAKMVIACDLFDDKLEIARQMGADYVFNSGKVDLPEEVRKLTGGMGADAAIDVTGAGPAIISSIRSVRPAGRVVGVGLPGKPVALDLANDLFYREVELTGISGRKIWQTWEDFAKVMSGPYYKLEQVMGGRYALKDFDKALADIRGGAPGKMLVYPNEANM